MAPDNEKGLVGAIVQMLVGFQWRHVSLIQTDAAYAHMLGTEFEKAWVSGGDRSIAYLHTIHGAATSSNNALSKEAIHQALKGVPSDDIEVNSRVIVLAAHQHHAFKIVEQARDPKYGGAFLDTIFVHSLPPNDYTATGSGVDKPKWMPRVPGYLGVVPLASTSAAHAAYLSRLNAHEEALGRPQFVRLPAYVAETVDAVVSFAKVLDPLSHEDRANGSLVREQLRTLSFSGVSGNVAFTAAGDRKEPRYTVINLGEGNEWKVVGSVGTVADTAELRVGEVCWADAGCGLAAAPLDRYSLPAVPAASNLVVIVLAAVGIPIMLVMIFM